DALGGGRRFDTGRRDGEALRAGGAGCREVAEIPLERPSRGTDRPGRGVAFHRAGERRTVLQDDERRGDRVVRVVVQVAAGLHHGPVEGPAARDGGDVGRRERRGRDARHRRGRDARHRRGRDRRRGRRLPGHRGGRGRVVARTAGRETERAGGDTVTTA